VLAGKHRPKALRELAVKTSIMRDHNGRIRNKGIDGLAIDFVAGHHRIGETVLFDRVFWDRNGWFVQRTESVDHSADLAAGMIGKLHHAEFDDFVARRIQTGGFNVQQDRPLGRLGF